MAHESFEDRTIAALLNRDFICIKVDREERPDIDSIYMSVCQMITGQGGWPLTIIMTSEKKPFFAGTYFPKESRFGITGLVDLIPGLPDYGRKSVMISSDRQNKLLLLFVRNRTPTPTGFPDISLLNSGYEELARRF